MSKNKKQLKSSSPKITGNEKQTRPESYIRIFWVNVISLIVGCIVLNYYAKRVEIEWLQDMLEGNYEIIKKYPDATVDERLGIKLGFNYAYLKHVCDNTPEDAVILFPPRDIILKQPTQFTEAELSQQWIYSFVYPRKVVIDGTGATDRVTHIAIMNGWGYDKLSYQVENKHENAIYPVNYPVN
ncbi:MAG: hypothetical protein LBH90_08865 [Tannerella sp.]|jgi:hypothetical protein|nr:hypothetical protein [Tannerella sp.]